jgi:hypothetical protein
MHGGGAEFDRPLGKNDLEDPWEVNVVTKVEIKTNNIPFGIEQQNVLILMTIFLNGL